MESLEQTTPSEIDIDDAILPGLRVGKKTDVGRHREQNEDTIYTFETFLQSSEGIVPFGLFVVADGMGGFQKGELASSLATRSAATYILEHLYFPIFS